MEPTLSHFINGIGTPIAQGCRVDGISCSYPVLNPLVTTNFSKLEWAEKAHSLIINGGAMLVEE